MRANVFKTAWIMVRSAWNMIDMCLYIIINNLRGKLTHDGIDKKLRRWAKKILKVIDLKVTTVNPHQVDFNHLGRTVLMCTHSSLYDIPITYHALPGSIRMIAKKELFSVPLFGRAMRVAGVPSINRQNRAKAIKDLAYVREQMDKGFVIWIAPEGTRSKDGKLQRLKKGGFHLAIEADAQIVPMAIRGASRILPKNTWHFHTGEQVEVHVGAPIDTSDYNIEQRDDLIAKVSEEMKKLLGDA